jgi:hypothetical protein
MHVHFRGQGSEQERAVAGHMSQKYVLHNIVDTPIKETVPTRTTTGQWTGRLTHLLYRSVYLPICLQYLSIDHRMSFTSSFISDCLLKPGEKLPNMRRAVANMGRGDCMMTACIYLYVEVFNGMIGAATSRREGRMSLYRVNDSQTHISPSLDCR